jgi:hypothetical protein
MIQEHLNRASVHVTGTLDEITHVLETPEGCVLEEELTQASHRLEEARFWIGRASRKSVSLEATRLGWNEHENVVG